MNLHKLINMDDPKCLYCQFSLEILLDSRLQTAKNPRIYIVYIFTCFSCKEIFEIHLFEDEPDNIYYFVFTCKELVVINKYQYLNELLVGFNIGNRNNLWPNMFKGGACVNIAPFSIDFSNKNKLHKKLKTYLLFS